MSGDARTGSYHYVLDDNGFFDIGTTADDSVVMSLHSDEGLGWDALRAQRERFGWSATWDAETAAGLAAIHAGGLSPRRDIVDEIDALVEESMAGGEPRVGYEFNDPQFPRCPHCGRHWHGLPVTVRIAQMYSNGRYDEAYSLAEDDTRVLCRGSEFIGPMPSEFHGEGISIAGIRLSETSSPELMDIHIDDDDGYFTVPTHGSGRLVIPRSDHTLTIDYNDGSFLVTWQVNV